MQENCRSTPQKLFHHFADLVSNMRRAFRQYKKSCHPNYCIKKPSAKNANGQGRDLSNRQIATYIFNELNNQGAKAMPQSLF